MTCKAVSCIHASGKRGYQPTDSIQQTANRTPQTADSKQGPVKLSLAFMLVAKEAISCMRASPKSPETMVLQWCHSGLTEVLNWCDSGVAEVLLTEANSVVEVDEHIIWL
jgi:hypothetical protein